jgi:shikimate 5-dehydrogenase
MAPEDTDIILLGSGSLAQAICNALATICTKATRVAVVSRTADAARALCYVANIPSQGRRGE